MLNRDEFSGTGHRRESGRTLARARWALAEAVEEIFSTTGSDGAPGVRRVEVRVEHTSPLAWMRDQDTTPKSYWSGREENAPEVATAGTAHVVADDGTHSLTEAVESIITPVLANSDPGVRYYGGARFDDGAGTSAEWDSFGDYRFVVPRFELVGDGSVCTLVCNLLMPRDLDRREEILAEIRDLRSPEHGGGGVLPEFVSRVDEPSFEGWSDNINHALDAFAAGEMGKVVMARRATMVFDRDVDAVEIAARLRAATPGCFHFYYEPVEGEAFIGATPERLYSRDGRAVRSEAVAGTRPRGDSSLDDYDLRDELLGSEKDRAEHRFVKDSIGEDLRPLCEALKVEEGVSEMKLASRRHLVSRVRGTLSEEVTDAEVLGVLHPTPAVGGYPKEEAKAGIRELETFDRGWYAGPVGWISRDAAEFAVGIRSGLARGNELSLYSGAGIVSGSTPEGEWAEIEQKISDFVGVLGIERSLDESRQHAAH